MNFNLKSDDIDYVKILYKDAHDFIHVAKTHIKNLTELEVYVFIKKEEFEKLPAPQEVSVGFATKNGLYKAETTLKYTRYEEPYLYIALKTPTEVEYQQNREYFRVNIEKDVIISYKKEEEFKTINCNTYDLSANGIRVKLDCEIDFPEEVYMDVKLDKKTIHAKAKYIRTDVIDGTVKASFVFSAFNFVEIGEADMDYISQVCIQKQLEDKRKSAE